MKGIGFKWGSPKEHLGAKIGAQTAHKGCFEIRKGSSNESAMRGVKGR